MRTFVFWLVIVVVTVAGLVQAVVAGYDRQFPAPGPVHTWQVREEGRGREEVTIWGRSFQFPEGDRRALADAVRTGAECLGGPAGKDRACLWDRLLP